MIVALFRTDYLDNDTIELLHSKMKSPFLARIHYPEVTLADLFVGNSITIFNRLLLIKSYANSGTQRFMAAREVHFVACMAGSSKQLIGDLMEVSTKYDIVASRLTTTGSSVLEGDVNVAAEDIVIEFVSTSGSDPRAFLAEASSVDPGVTIMMCNVPTIDAVFSSCTPNFPTREHCTLCLVKPHIMKEKRPGPILKAIHEAGFKVETMYSVHFDFKMADYVMDVYRGIVPEFTSMMQNLVSGPLLAVMVSGGPDVVQEFRELCGPLEPELGRILRPKSLRARFGNDVVNNAVHCTDLPEDGSTECTYVFDTIANI